MTPYYSQQTLATCEPPSMRLGTGHRTMGAITCQLVTRSDWSYEVCVLPHWDPCGAVIERFDKTTPALLRHAEIARRLRESGWIVVEDSVPLSIHAAS